ncbi:pneumococcal serine-rich repeat protein isoform X6 [Anastrepha ludens]|uniref:pneumococcal serine-rich repeat protein isoform X6 n=1 Tax=Anastrepha ludens TaxID=28586 RepID=UPI0023AECEC1|nr:pneumococcal serine-rich repeat protein isoform X6 [Anastrepha ludens]
MEVATTNNHHHNHHHLGHQLHHPAHRLPMAKQSQPQQQQQQLQQQQNNLSLTITTPATATDDASGNGNVGKSSSPRSPFQREVREWQRIDPDTGALLSGRLEADRWINGPLNSYGKISDSQNISQPNGTQHTQRKQLEVLQKRTPNGAVQVIRAQTVQTSSSRSWSSSNSNSASTSASASASASPICMTSNGGVGGGVSGGGRSILHNHNHTHNNNHNHFHSTLQQHLAEANTHWLQLSPPTIAATVDISEVSTDDDLEKAAAANATTTTETAYIVDDGETDDDAPCDYSISRSGSAGDAGSKGQMVSSVATLLPQPLSSSSSASTLHSQSSARLLPDTAPSLKLSNLMKSSSGGSNSSSNNSVTTMNTHKRAVGKVSLHAIVGSGGVDNNSRATRSEAIKSPKSNTATTKHSSNGAVTGTKTWQQQQQQPQRSARHLEQATLYGQNSNSAKSRVGVADCDDCCAAVTALADDADESHMPCHQHQHHRHNHHHHHHQREQQAQQQTLQSELVEATPTRRRDLESFRHYAGSAGAARLTTQPAASAANDNAKDDDLRLSTRQLRRQQQPFGGQSSSTALLQRSHSISTDDLSNEWESNEAVAESNEWRRVSKLRRSFQSSSSPNNTFNTSSDQTKQQSPSTARRVPFDLPGSSVSVSRMRAELESGRRLTTAMRNNHVDLAALESILHGPKEVVKITGNSKHSTLLTAESLKEIRGRLKKLSDESLYKDDFIAYQQLPAADEHIEVQQSVRRKLATPLMRQLTPEGSPEISTPPPPLAHHQSAFKAVGTQRASPESGTLAQHAATGNLKHPSNSLESRQKVKDTNSSEWHSRRKSYGFEKMSPPDSKSMLRMDASTDSGLGRSGELGNWSPTETTPAAARATVIHFGEPAKTVTQPHYRAAKSPARRTPDEDLHKRHSIAVDESQYVRENLRKTSQVHLNGFYESPEVPNMQLSRYEGNAECNPGTTTGANINSILFQRTQNAQKRVEFCKTEVHFAAESGRVNIVETDGKPPPTNNFRRRRRTTSGPLQSLTKPASATAAATTATTTTATTSANVTHFGDDHQRHRTIASSVVAYKATLVEPPGVSDTAAMPAITNVTVSVQKVSGDAHAEGSRGSYASTTSGIDTTDNENDEIAAIRGILKNKPIKPKPYHLGENIDSADALWGVQLKPVAGGGNGGMSVREKDDSPTTGINKSVAERIRIVEKRHEHSAQNGYSTKINLSLEEPVTSTRVDWPSADLPKSNIMSIELHSPQISLEKRDSFKRTQSPPRAKPRTTTSAVHSSEHPRVHVATTVKQAIAERSMPTEQQREALKIVKEARGARKLREHELSYFGVPNAHNHNVHESKTKLLPNTSTNIVSTSKRSLPSRQRLTISGNEDTKSMRRHEAKNVETTTATNELTAETKAQTTTKWQLLNDKPDLLRHSPIAVEPQLIRRTGEVQPRERNSSVERSKRVPPKELRLHDEHDDHDERDADIGDDVDIDDDDDDEEEDHYYENITNEITPVFKVKSPQPYDRKTDVERDAFLLSEMNENADLTMKALSDEAAHKDRRRRRSSLHRRESKPLETIDEKMVAHKANDSCIAVKMSRGTFASEAKRNPRHTTTSPNVPETHTRVRTSSQSSVESCPRARSRSLSSEREYENIRTPKPTRTAATSSTKTLPKATGKQHHRSSSRESQRSARLQYSSGDEVHVREEHRVRMKSKRSANSTNATPSRSGDRRSKKESVGDQRQHLHHSSTSRDVERRRAASSTTHASQREERAECATVPQQQRTTSSGRSSSSKRRQEHTSNNNTSGGSAERHTNSRTASETKPRSVNAGVRLLRSLRGRTDDNAAHSTQHRSSASEREKGERERERAHEKEREKDKQSKSRGHSTSKTQHHNSSEHHRIGCTAIHHLPAQSGTMSSKTREHKKSSLAGVQKQHEQAATTTHSKSSQIINGRHTGHTDGHHKSSDPPQMRSRQQHQHESSTSAHRKRSEHTARERK